MAVKCDIPLFKRLAPKRFVPFTPNQLARLSKMDPNRQFKLLGVLSQNLDDESSQALKMLVGIGKERLKNATRVGVTLTEKEAQAAASADQIAAEVGADKMESYSRVADKVAASYRKGAVMTEGERAIVYPVFAKQMDELPMLIEQLDAALMNGNDNMVAYLGSELAKTMASAAAIAGDKNAVSTALKSFENLNKVLRDGGKLSSFLANGPC